MERTDACSPAAMTLPRKVGQLVLAGLGGPEFDAETAALFRERQLGGAILFSRNIVSAEQVRALTAALHAVSAPAGLPALIGVDQEGGRVLRTAALPGAAHWPAAMAIAATGDLALAEAIGAAIGGELRSLGITVAFAPDADVNADRRNPVIGARAFGDVPEDIAAFVRATIRGHHAAGIASTAKHFPGHGDTAVDSHTALPTIPHDLAHLRRVDLVPFAAAIAAGVPLIMTAHIRLPALEPSGLPATLSRRILTGLLREEMGYDGVIVTDAMMMQAIKDHYGIVPGSVASIIAGADLVIPLEGQEGATVDALLTAVADGRLPEARVDASVRRILRLKASLAASAPPSAPFGDPTYRALAQEATRRGITVLAAPPDMVPLAAGSAPAVVECVLGNSTLAEELAETAPPLLAAVRARFPAARGVALDAAAPTDAEQAAARALAAAADFLILGTSDLIRFPRQAEAVLSLARAAARHVVIIAQRGPYDLGALPPLPHAALLTTYSDQRDALAAAVAVLAGDAAPSGRLPVTASPAFPRGAGI